MRSHRAHLAAGLLLHQRPLRDTSLIVEVYTRDYGRFTAFARGARGGMGKRSRFSALRPFQPLLLSWQGRGEAPTLTAAEADGVAIAVPTAQLLSGYYLNELLLRLTAHHDPHPELYELYLASLQAMASGAHTEWCLRRFEKQLLDMLGFGFDFSTEQPETAALNSASRYDYSPGAGFRVAEPGAGDYSGRMLQSLEAERMMDDERQWREARELMRVAINHCLEGRELRTRTVARAIARRLGPDHAELNRPQGSG